MIIPIDTENAFDNVQHPFLVYILSKLESKEKFLYQCTNCQLFDFQPQINSSLP